jgi:hypothetical protein
VVNAQILGSGLAAEAEQRRWLEEDLARHAGRRTFLCLHYPPYVADPAEPESYDNLAEPGRSWLLGLVETYRPEAMFCGHVHNFFYNRHGATECYVLPSTAFVRNDYSELHRVEPDDPEHGRNDLPKLGYFLVKIHERGHVCHMVRTHGATVDPGETLAAPAERVAPLHTKENRRAPLGVDLRHPWAEIVEITPTGALDEFERKKARNDYPLMALWEMGIRKLRVPLQDLEDARTRERMRVLGTLGHEFTVYTQDVPHGAARDLLIEHHDLVAAWEVVVSWPEAARSLAAARAVKDKAPLAVHLSKLRSKDDLARDGSRYYHFINHGFVAAERDDLAALLAAPDVASVVDGVVFRVARHASPWAEIQAAAAIAAGLRVRAAVHVRMAGANPAEAFQDDLANANRVVEALAAALTRCGPERPGIDVFVDTFADVDRGYFVRNGLIDRRSNPRLAGAVVRHLYGALNESAAVLTPGVLRDIPSGRIVTLSRPGELLALVLPERQLQAELLLDGDGVKGTTGAVRVIDLASGEVRSTAWRRADGAIALVDGLACAAPTLVGLATS